MRRALVFGLRARGIDVLTALDAEMINRPDEDHLIRASSESRVIYSFNVGDFCALHELWISTRRSHAGIIVSPQQRFTVGGELRALMRLTAAVSAEAMRDRIEFLSRWG